VGVRADANPASSASKASMVGLDQRDRRAETNAENF